MDRLSIALVAVAIAGAACGPDTPPTPTFDETVRTFVSATYPHGVPYDSARALGTPAEPILLRLLDEPAMAAHRSNIVITLGMLGSPAAAQRIVQIIEDGTGVLSPDDASVRMDAVMALGYAAYAAGPGAAPSPPLTYLLDGLDASVWPVRVAWRLSNDDGRAEQLRMRSIAALGLSGHPSALTALQQLLPVGGGRGGGGGGRGGGGRGAPLPPSDDAAINESIRANEFIAANGMSRYYETVLIR